VTNPEPLNAVRTARLRIWRGTDRDGLVRLRVNSDPSLAIRFSCFNANVCKECTMLIDGKVEYACIAKLHTRLMQLDPLPNLAIVRDLVTDTLSRKERF
jgi:succinate dehydrogenase/fumarate reductase-like Fe-S protein